MVGDVEKAYLLHSVREADPPSPPVTPELLLYMLRVVTFDAAGTLIRLVRPPGVIYAEVARLFGFNLDPDRVQEAFRNTWGAFAPPAESAGPLLDDDRDWWHALVARTMEVAGYRIDPFDDYFKAVYQSFARPGVWELWPDVQLVMTELASLGIRLGVISNFDRRLYEIFAHLGIREVFEQVIISSEIGVRKPGARIFKEAARRFNVDVSEILHVGDELESDFAGARAAGLAALLVDHKASKLSGILSLVAP